MRMIQKVSSSMVALMAVFALTQAPFTTTAYASKGSKCKHCERKGGTAKKCKCSDCDDAKADAKGEQKSE